MTDSNPFEDPEVKKAAGGKAEIPRTYGQSDAYDDPVSSNFSANEQKIALTIGSQVAQQQASNIRNDIRNDFDTAMETQAGENDLPEAPKCWIKCWNWLPLNLFAFIGGCLMVTLPLLDIIFNSDLGFISFLLFVYLLIFGIMTMFIEAPSFKLTRWMQLKVYFWFKFLGRMWGRSWFYLFSSILCFAELDNAEVSAASFAGFYLIAISIIGFVFSRLSGKLHRRIFEFVAAGTEAVVSDELLGRFMRKFDELDTDADGRIGSKELFMLGRQANREMTNTERQVCIGVYFVCVCVYPCACVE